MARSTFLTANARVLAALADCPTVVTHCKTAAKAASSSSARGRGAADVFENKVVALMLQDRETIVEELLDRIPPELHVVTASLVEEPRTRALADIVLTYRATGRKTVTIAVNVKTERTDGSSRSGWQTDNKDLCSLPAFVALATDERFEVLGKMPRGNWTGALIEWVAGRRKILDGRDYGVLNVKLKHATVESVEGRSVLASVAGKRPIVRRHTNRAVVQTIPATGVLPDDFDVNAQVSQALLPKPSWDELRLQILAAYRDQVDDLPGLAAWLLDLSDGDLAALLGSALGLPHSVQQ